MPTDSPLQPPQPALEEPHDSGCRLTDRFAIIVQFILATIALASLFAKRMRERPQRPFKVWWFDTAKQGVGGAFVHTLNVITSLIIAREVRESSSNPCVWYFLNILLDCTVGVFILFLWLRVLSFICIKLLNMEGLESGYYGSPVQIRIWARQTVLFSTGLFLTKVIVVFLFDVFRWLQSFGSWVLRPLQAYPRAEVVIVMLLFPLLMNVCQFWLVDSVIKNKRGAWNELQDADGSTEVTGVRSLDEVSTPTTKRGLSAIPSGRPDGPDLELQVADGMKTTPLDAVKSLGLESGIFPSGTNRQVQSIATPEGGRAHLGIP